jgi:hypothetical protein
MLIGAILWISGCNYQPARPTLDPNIIETIAAKTVQAQLAETDLAASPTATQPLPTPAPTRTNTLTPQPTPSATATTQSILKLTPGTTAITYPVNAIPSAVSNGTPVPQPVGDFGIPIDHDPANGVTIQKNQEFQTTWVIKNVGTTTWNTNYYITYFGGNRIGKGDNSYFLTREVKPNDIGSISVKMVAPAVTGTYKSIWFLMNDQKKAIMELNIVINVP